MGSGRKAGEHFRHLKPGKALGTLETFSGEHGWVRIFNFPDELPFKCDLTHLAKLGRLGEVLFHGFQDYAAGKRSATVRGAQQNSSLFSKYLNRLVSDGELSREPKPAELTGYMVAGFATWLTKKSLSGRNFSTRTAYSAYSVTKTLIHLGHEKFRNEFLANFSIPENPLGYSANEQYLSYATGAEERSSQALARDVIKRLQAAAATEALGIMDNPGKEPIISDQLFPFFLLLAIRTAANPSSIAGLQRDCLEENPVEKGGWFIHFSKARSGEGKVADYPWVDNECSDRLSPLNVVRFLLKWTEPLVADAPRPVKDRVFLVRRMHYVTSTVLPTSKAIALNYRNGSELADNFVKRHGLSYFQPRIIRETGAALRWEATKSVFQVQSLLNHSSINTTVRYLLSKIIKAAAAEDMAEANLAITESFKRGRPTIKDKPLKEVTEKLHLSEIQQDKILRGEYFTGLGSCTDPYDSPMPDQTKGHLCTMFWACISCGKAIIAREHLPLVIARQIGVREQAQFMNAEVWRKKYGEIDEQLTGIINCFSEKSIEEARAKAAAYLTTVRTDLITFLKTPLTS